MLADKLVGNLSYDTDKEVQNLELLKLRFGETSMHHCEIMVRDLEESKRVNANVQDRLAQRQTGEAQKEDARQHFWPHLLGEDMRLHPRMQDRLAAFGKAYSVIKNPRLLVWKKQLGVVELNLDFNGVERSFSVSPLHATLIMHFEGKAETWRLSDLAREVELPPSVVQKRMMLWVNQGVVSESNPGPVYRLVKDQTQNRSGGEGMESMVLEDNTEAAVSADANDAESDKIIVQFLTGMLTNFSKLPLDRIHNNLKMFMSGGDNKYDKSLPELQQLLWRLCSDGKLEHADGEYRLVK
ncbi:Putative subunit of the Anaphase Promoting Complex Putative subunite of the Anaphase Promoting Compl [Ectocarpus siliculosus]|uniref:Anaphase-promoting complex subunit 2 n=1 Tax=Ectocarpus siliculosus TaxID=2880 RepID=D8LNH8_ECTSI|nr:Putative subunit of the Anaphase Promoting Complex Putative subunite of the Anaphase Promoting Compl [Ectocarpus siliculosus]|eukprot:CBN77335.1 Putative subunit of the Anaphase Promoting Complex Putative subunite of the Anaphase Promoting Compl [Ectocarpus siliculosus]